MAKKKKQVIPGILKRVWMDCSSQFLTEDGKEVLIVDFRVQFSKLDSDEMEEFDRRAVEIAKSGKRDTSSLAKYIHNIELIGTDGELIPYSAAFKNDLLKHDEYAIAIQTSFIELHTTRNWKAKLAKN